MGHRRRNSIYNSIPQPALPPAAAPPPPPAPAAAPFSPLTQLRSLLPSILPTKSAASIPFKMPDLPVEELAGGLSNTVRGLVLNGNWWLLLLIIFLFFPNVSSKMFGGILKE